MGDLDLVLASLASAEWEHWTFGKEDDPVGLAFVRRSETYADVVLLHSDKVSIAYRAPLIEGDEYSPLSPDTVMWFFCGNARQPIEELLKLPPQEGPNAPPKRCYTGVIDARVPQKWIQAGVRLIRSAGKAPIDE